MKKSWKDRNSLALSLARIEVLFQLEHVNRQLKKRTDIHANPVRKVEMAAKMYVVQMKMYDVCIQRV